MTKEEAFSAMGTLMPMIIKRYNRETVVVDVDMQLMIKKVWEQFLFPKGQLNIAGCGPCVENAMDVIYSYYEREYPKYISTLTTEPATESESATEDSTDLPTSSPADEPKEVKPRKKTNGRK